MNAYHFIEDQKVLLLGEGNFSFTLSLIEICERLDTFNNLYSTCYEDVIDCGDTLGNIDKIKSNGVNVVLGVDATKLSNHPVISTLKFDKIIFNFPHIKGKMKINLNRDLIKEFFISCQSVLNENGVVVVALCSGQGGTHLEKNNRKWENTWQIVEMAAHGNFVLYKVDTFPNKIFPHYLSSGFRGKNKSFNTIDALVHQFIPFLPPEVSIDKEKLQFLTDYHSLPQYENLKFSFIHYDTLKCLPFSCDSPQSYLKNILISCVNINSSKTEVSELLPMTVSDSSDSSNPHCFVDNAKKNLRKSLLETLPILSSQQNYILYGYIFNKPSSDFSISPVNCELIIFGTDCKITCLKFISLLQNIFNCEFNVVENEIVLNFQDKNPFLLTTFQLIKQKNEQVPLCVINLDLLSLYLFNIESWKQLWSKHSSFSMCKTPLFQIPSFPSQSYSFDINIITNPLFNLNSFVNLLWQIGGNMISAVLLLNEYKHADSVTISHCYRIVYKSYEKPIYRKRIVDFHENVIGKSLQLLYNVVIG